MNQTVNWETETTELRAIGEIMPEVLERYGLGEEIEEAAGSGILKAGCSRVDGTGLRVERGGGGVGQIPPASQYGTLI